MKLTAKQRRVLTTLAAGGSLFAHRVYRRYTLYDAQHNDIAVVQGRVIDDLKQADLLDHHKDTITDAGRAALSK